MATKKRNDLQNTLWAGGIILALLLALNFIVAFKTMPFGNYLHFVQIPHDALLWHAGATIILGILAIYFTGYLSEFYFRLDDGVFDPQERKQTNNNAFIAFFICLATLFTANLFGQKAFIVAAGVITFLVALAMFAGFILPRILNSGAQHGGSAGEKLKADSAKAPEAPKDDTEAQSSIPIWVWIVAGVLLLVLVFGGSSTTHTIVDTGTSIGVIEKPKNLLDPNTNQPKPATMTENPAMRQPE